MMFFRILYLDNIMFNHLNRNWPCLLGMEKSVAWFGLPWTSFIFRWLNIKGVYTAFHISITLFLNHLNWNRPYSLDMKKSTPNDLSDRSYIEKIMSYASWLFDVSIITFWLFTFCRFLIQKSWIVNRITIILSSASLPEYTGSSN